MDPALVSKVHSSAHKTQDTQRHQAGMQPSFARLAQTLSGVAQPGTGSFLHHIAALSKSTARGFEPLRAEPNGFLVHHLSHSVTLSMLLGFGNKQTSAYCGVRFFSPAARREGGSLRAQAGQSHAIPSTAPDWVISPLLPELQNFTGKQTAYQRSGAVASVLGP